MKIITHRKHTYVPSFSLEYHHDGGGYSFPCDKDGKVDTSVLQPGALKNYNHLQKTSTIIRHEHMPQRIVMKDGKEVRDEYGSFEYEDVPGPKRMYSYKVTPEVKDYGRQIAEPAVGECNHCKRHVTLHGFTNTCECGADYNMSGQELSPRENWGEETSESLSDILNAEFSYDDEQG